jgi:hypothetical protein
MDRLGKQFKRHANRTARVRFCAGETARRIPYEGKILEKKRFSWFFAPTIRRRGL